MDFSSSFANGIYTDTRFFSGILGASDITTQLALQSLSALTQSTMPCDTLLDNWCFSFSVPNQQLTLFVAGISQSKWPQTGVSATDILLLETSDGILLENGTDNILLE